MVVKIDQKDVSATLLYIHGCCRDFLYFRLMYYTYYEEDFGCRFSARAPDTSSAKYMTGKGSRGIKGFERWRSCQVMHTCCLVRECSIAQGDEELGRRVVGQAQTVLFLDIAYVLMLLCHMGL